MNKRTHHLNKTSYWGVKYHQQSTDMAVNEVFEFREWGAPLSRVAQYSEYRAYAWRPSANQKEMDGTKPRPSHFLVKDLKLAPYWVPTICCFVLVPRYV